MKLFNLHFTAKKNNFLLEQMPVPSAITYKNLYLLRSKNDVMTSISCINCFLNFLKNTARRNAVESYFNRYKQNASNKKISQKFKHN